MTKDLVSIIIPVFNNVNLLRDSLSSVINQTYDNIEIIIVDDGSKEYKKILLICKQFNKKIKIIRFKHNKGVSSALNKGISISKGKYINWLSHDDLFFPTKIEEQVKSLKGSTNKISATNFIIWDYEKNLYTNSKQKKKNLMKPHPTLYTPYTPLLGKIVSTLGFFLKECIVPDPTLDPTLHHMDFFVFLKRFPYLLQCVFLIILFIIFQSV